MAFYFIAGFLYILPCSAQDNYIIVANKSVQDQFLSRSTLENIFLGKKSRWNDGIQIVPVTLKEGAAHESFINEVIHKSVNAYMNYWRKMIFTGKGVMPIAFENDIEVMNYINRTEGAIGYISSKNLMNEFENIKTIAITE